MSVLIADLDGWLVVVTWVNLDDEDVVVELGGKAAGDGSQLVTAQVSISYVGAEPTVRYGDNLAIAMINGTTEFDEAASCETAQYGTGADAQTDIRSGDDALLAIVCREIPVSALDDLLLRVTHSETGGQRYFALEQR